MQKRISCSYRNIGVSITGNRFIYQTVERGGEKAEVSTEKMDTKSFEHLQKEVGRLDKATRAQVKEIADHYGVTIDPDKFSADNYNKKESKERDAKKDTLPGVVLTALDTLFTAMKSLKAAVKDRNAAAAVIEKQVSQALSTMNAKLAQIGKAIEQGRAGDPMFAGTKVGAELRIESRQKSQAELDREAKDAENKQKDIERKDYEKLEKTTPDASVRELISKVLDQRSGGNIIKLDELKGSPVMGERLQKYFAAKRAGVLIEVADPDIKGQTIRVFATPSVDMTSVKIEWKALRGNVTYVNSVDVALSDRAFTVKRDGKGNEERVARAGLKYAERGRDEVAEKRAEQQFKYFESVAKMLDRDTKPGQEIILEQPSEKGKNGYQMRIVKMSPDLYIVYRRNLDDKGKPQGGWNRFEGGSYARMNIEDLAGSVNEKMKVEGPRAVPREDMDKVVRELYDRALSKVESNYYAIRLLPDAPNIKTIKADYEKSLKEVVSLMGQYGWGAQGVSEKLKSAGFKIPSKIPDGSFEIAYVDHDKKERKFTVQPRQSRSSDRRVASR